MLWGFVLTVLEYCSAVWFSAADTHLKLLNHVVSGASFLTGGVFESDFAHRRSVIGVAARSLFPLFSFILWVGIVGLGSLTNRV